jgi:hypothetical protein
MCYAGVFHSRIFYILAQQMKTLYKMKQKFWLLAIPMLILFSCEKEKTTPVTKQTGITYPDSIYYSKSILSLPDSAILLATKSYSFAANLEKDASLTIKITDLSPVDTNGYSPKWYYAFNPTGWVAQKWDNGTQTFIASQTGKIDLQIMFGYTGDTGICKLDFYENGSTISKTKYLRWNE